MAPKLTTEADIRIGGRVRAARVAAGLSQTDLSRVLGVTFQQLQKYEKGKNRLCVSRLQVIANHLGLTVADFYDDPDHAAAFEPRPLTVREAEAALLAAAMALAEARAREAQTVSLAEAA